MFCSRSRENFIYQRGRESSGERGTSIVEKFSGGILCRTGPSVGDDTTELSSHNNRGHEKQSGCNNCNEKQGQTSSQE